MLARHHDRGVNHIESGGTACGATSQSYGGDPEPSTEPALIRRARNPLQSVLRDERRLRAAVQDHLPAGIDDREFNDHRGSRASLAR